ncbi:MBL fold metallo-hydrolase [Synergistales bacterium]|nr:MBL fold metallo-hydrolase [Synergistales bacterium]
MPNIMPTHERIMPDSFPSYPSNFIRFLGTSGTRFIMLSQRRASGGIWFSYGGVNGVIDPGPGSLVHICKADPALDPTSINALLLTHRHIDHCNDLNALAEGMTLVKTGSPKGELLLTADSLEPGDSALMKYMERKIKHIHIHKDRLVTPLCGGAITAESVKHKHHGVQCYGLILRAAGFPSWGVISDTAPLDYFPERYRGCEIMIINTTMLQTRPQLDHLSLTDVSDMLRFMSPSLALITHMGGQVLDYGAENISRSLSTYRTKAIAAEDGMTVSLDNQRLLRDFDL